MAMTQEAAACLMDLRSPIEEKLLASPILHTDETSLSVEGKRQWVHAVGTPEATWLACHPRRGLEAMEAIGLLPRYEGTMIHDAWKPYFSYSQADHALCNAHLLRELKALYEIHGQAWAKRIIDLLLEMKTAVEQAGGVLNDPEAQAFEHAFDDLLREAKIWEILLLPHGSDVPSRETRKLIRRLWERRTETLRFLRERHVPFDNNLAERDLRMAKMKEKISGTFRSTEGVHAFCLMRSVISTIQKQKKSVGKTLERLLQGHFDALFSPV
ncbi:transposase [Parageobacillus caldoxylosilyticus]|nr:transposase [Parageobacillus caldoxylosilyticus]BDG39008.1 transposase [Parageobacillus caldoxylosilyticus]